MKEVKTPKKPLIYYYMIVIIALLLFNFLAVPFITEREIKDVDYGTFIDMTNEGKVGKAEIQEQENMTPECPFQDRRSSRRRPS